MRPFHATLIEESRLLHISLDSGNHREFAVKKKNGLLQRQWNESWQNHSLEFKSAADAYRFLKLSPERKRNEAEEEKLTVPTFLLKNQERLLSFLNQIRLSEWKIVYRNRLTNKIIIRNDEKKRKTRFEHATLTITMRIKNWPAPIEISEGVPAGSKFNLDGLCQEMEDMVENVRQAKSLRLQGNMPVILNAGEGAIFFHEILGHSLEADYVRQNISPVTLSHIHQPLFSQDVTIVSHDGKDTFFNGCPYDDEGETPPSPLLVANGRLQQLISDTFHKDVLKLPQAGHARLEDFSTIPQPRLFGLYVLPGPYDPQEIIESTAWGMMAKKFGEGQVDFLRNFFYFTIREAFLIEKGKVSVPLGPLMVSGDIQRVFSDLAMIGNDFKYDRGSSFCIKNGQRVPVRGGQPTVKINNLTVQAGSHA